MSSKPARARAIILHDGNILMIFRRKEGKEYWTLPGGGVEEGETPEEAVIREVMEETTIVVSVMKFLHSDIEDGEEKIYYLCAYQDGIPRLGNGPEAEKRAPDNVYEPQWVALDRLSSLDIKPATAKAIGLAGLN